MGFDSTIPNGGLLLTLDDCVAFGDLSRELVLAIAEHERVPELSAAAIGCELSTHVEGIVKIREIAETILDAAVSRGDRGFAQALESSLTQFVASHPGILL